MVNFIKYIKPALHLIIVVASGTTFFSCIKEDNSNELVDDGSIIFLCEGQHPVTKTTLNGLQTEWVESTDKVGIFSPQASTSANGTPGVVNIPLTALSSGARSQFSGSVYWNTGEHNFYSYYPYSAGTPPYTAVPVTLPANQTQQAGNNSNHLSTLDFLVAKPHMAKYPGTSGSLAAVSLKYQHLFSIIEFQIIRSSGSGTITKVQLRGKVPLAFESGTVNIAQNTPASGVPYAIDGMANVSNSSTVILTNAVTPTNSYETTPKVYMAVLPGVHTGELKIAFESGGVFKEVVKSDFTIERGKKYVVKVDAALATIPQIDGFELEPVNVGGVVWAPVNAGYREDLRGGEFFQWHRKYGFDKVFTVMTANSTLWNDDLDQETALDKYKNVFFKSMGSSYEWMPVYHNEWNLTEKFNPCPSGWRLPTKAEALALIAYGSTSISTDNAGGVDGLKGRWIGPNHDNPDLRTTTAVFFPFSGIISYNTATWPASPTVGNYWLAYYGEPSTTYNGQVMTVNNNQTTAPNTSIINKASAVSVRCVQKSSSAEALLYTVKPIDIIEGKVTTGGFIESQGSLPITERGVFYGAAANPASTKVVAAAAGTGSFSVEITGLEEAKTYYVRAYAKNSAGTVYYGDQYKFVKKNPANYNGQEVTINGVTWAPWNAGFNEATHKYGLMYQWHRKYGQNLDETPAPAILSGPTTLATANSYSNMNTFYVSGSPPYDVISPQQASWNMARQYNPCPTGWRVPTQAEFQSLVDSGHSWGTGPYGLPGRWFGPNHAGSKEGCVFLPIAGARNQNGLDFGRSNTAYYWTSTPQSTSAVVLNFGNSYLVLNNNVMPRSMGASIRCVKE